MIEKNGKPYEPSEKELKIVKDKYQDKNGNLTVVWHPSRATPRPHLVNQKVRYEETLEYPPSFPIATHYTVINEKGLQDQYRYYESKTYDSRAKIDRYTPAALPFVNTKIIPKTEMELQWFLVFCCPIIANGEAGKALAKTDPNYKPWLRFSLAEADAKERLRRTMLKNKVEALITSDLPEAELRDVAAMYRVPNPDTEAEDVIRVALLSSITAGIQGDPHLAYEKFLERVDAIGNPDKDDQVVALVERAIAAGVVKYSSGSSSWVLVDENKVAIESMCRVNDSFSGQKRVVFERHLKNNKEHFNRVKEAVANATESLQEKKKSVTEKDTEDQTPQKGKGKK